MSYKKNLSLDGLDKILKIKNGMNTNRLGCWTCVYCSSTYKGCILVKVNTNLFWCNRKIYVYNNINEAIFIVSNLKELYIVIDHFNKYPLITKKWFYCILFKIFETGARCVGSDNVALYHYTVAPTRCCKHHVGPVLLLLLILEGRIRQVKKKHTGFQAD